MGLPQPVEYIGVTFELQGAPVLTLTHTNLLLMIISWSWLLLPLTLLILIFVYVLLVAFVDVAGLKDVASPVRISSPRGTRCGLVG